VSDQEPTEFDTASVANAWNRSIIEQFRAHAGKLGGDFDGVPVLLLHTTGAKTGEIRVNPLMYLEQVGGIFIFASKAGSHKNPDWYHNLRATPRVIVEVGTERYEAMARVLEGSSRDEIYALQATKFPNFAEFQAKTRRVIPVIALERL
jgi:deazaflavin-dependent oxidoreductase (nitroreductase family)